MASTPPLKQGTFDVAKNDLRDRQSSAYDCRLLSDRLGEQARDLGAMARQHPELGEIAASVRNYADQAVDIERDLIIALLALDEDAGDDPEQAVRDTLSDLWNDDIWPSVLDPKIITSLKQAPTWGRRLAVLEEKVLPGIRKQIASVLDICEPHKDSGTMYERVLAVALSSDEVTGAIEELVRVLREKQIVTPQKAHDLLSAANSTATVDAIADVFEHRESPADAIRRVHNAALDRVKKGESPLSVLATLGDEMVEAVSQ